MLIFAPLEIVPRCIFYYGVSATKCCNNVSIFIILGYLSTHDICVLDVNIVALCTILIINDCDLPNSSFFWEKVALDDHVH